MAKVTFIDPIDHISGKLSKSHRTCYNYRKAKNNDGINVKYTSIPNPSTAAPSADQQAQRTRFGAIATAVQARKTNPTKKMQDMAAFKAQSQYKTLNAYLWNVCAAEYDAED